MFKKLILVTIAFIANSALAVPLIYNYEFSGTWYAMYDYRFDDQTGVSLDYQLSFVVDMAALGGSSTSPIWLKSLSINTSNEDHPLADFTVDYNLDLDIASEADHGSVDDYSESSDRPARTYELSFDHFYMRSFDWPDDLENAMTQINVGDPMVMELWHEFYYQAEDTVSNGYMFGGGTLTSITPYYENSNTRTVPETPAVFLLGVGLFILLLRRIAPIPVSGLKRTFGMQ